MKRIPWSHVVLALAIAAICGMAMYVTGQDNQCVTEIDWIGRCR